MIFYATKLTFDRYKIKTVDEFQEPFRAMAEEVIEKEKTTECLSGE